MFHSAEYMMESVFSHALAITRKPKVSIVQNTLVCSFDVPTMGWIQNLLCVDGRVPPICSRFHYQKMLSFEGFILSLIILTYPINFRELRRVTQVCIKQPCHMFMHPKIQHIDKHSLQTTNIDLIGFLAIARDFSFLI